MCPIELFKNFKFLYIIIVNNIYEVFDIDK